MKKWIWFLLILLAISAGALGSWYYYPQYKIDRLKAQNAASTETGPNQKTASVSYIQHLKGQPSKELNHLALGDSVIQGRGSNQGGFIRMANDDLSILTGKKIRLDNQGLSGATSSNLLQSITAPGMEDRIKSADIITINIGGNDLVKLALKEGPVKALQDYQNVKSGYEDNLLKIFTYIRKINPDATLVYNELYNVVDTGESFYPATSKLLNDWNLIAYETTSKFRPSIVIPSSDALKPENRKEWIYDSIHPNDKGHKLIAEQMIKALKSNYRK